MKVEDAREHYYSHSASASSSARQLAFAGIAVIWILATQNDQIELLNTVWRSPLILFVGALALDLLQYYWLAGFWGAFARFKERKEEQEFGGAPEWGNWVGLLCFWSKGLLVAIGYVMLIGVLWPVLFR